MDGPEGLPGGVHVQRRPPVVQTGGPAGEQMHDCVIPQQISRCLEKDVTTLCVSGAPVQEGLPCRRGRLPSTNRGAHAAEEEGRTAAVMTAKPGLVFTALC